MPLERAPATGDGERTVFDGDPPVLGVGAPAERGVATDSFVDVALERSAGDVSAIASLSASEMSTSSGTASPSPVTKGKSASMT
jgi:hypothetical protein